MKNIFLLILAFFVTACGPKDTQRSEGKLTVKPDTAASVIKEVERPEKIKEMAKQFGEAVTAEPLLKILEPADGAVLDSTVRLRIELSGELRGYKPHKDPQTGGGPHIHVILDNLPYEPYYDLSKPFEIKNVSEGRHTLRVFASTPWHESYKNPNAFKMVSFTVKGKETGDTVRVDPQRPLLTYSRPKGEYKGADAEAIMLDFWLSNCELTGDGGQYRVRYAVNKEEPKYIDEWHPVWLTGFSSGKHTILIELVDNKGNPVDNGGYNSTSREIIISR
jgi:hypothetical protein